MVSVLGPRAPAFICQVAVSFMAQVMRPLSPVSYLCEGCKRELDILRVVEQEPGKDALVAVGGVSLAVV